MAVSHATLNRLFSNCQGELAFDHVSAEGSQTVRALQSELWAILERGPVMSSLYPLGDL